MSAPLFSDHWHRFKDSRPSLARDVKVQRHMYRGVPSYVLHRPSTGAIHRVNQNAFELINHLDGNASVGELWERAIETQGQNAPTQTELISLLAQLHEGELLTVDRTLSAEQLFSRGQERERAENHKRYLNPLYLRFTLLDPDALLGRLTAYVGRLFTRAGFITWCVLIGIAFIQVLPRSAELSAEVSTFDFLSPLHAGLFFVIYPLLKLLHELAHGVVVKRNGGEVHELGIALMVLLPIPYVDATAAAAFPEKHSRMLVGAAGIFVELAVAAIAALVWSVTVSGPIHDLALMLMLIGGLSTVIFNANPLLKFDGYYVLADAIEIPNLADRAKRFVLALGKKHIFGIEDEAALHTHDAAESTWLCCYGVLSCVYRIVLMLTIAYLLSEQYFFFGVVLAGWALATSVGLPVGHFIAFLTRQTRAAQPRALFATTLLLGLFASGIFWLQLPTSTVAKGIVWLPDNAIVRITQRCEVTEVLVTENVEVDAGTALLRCEDPALTTKAEILQAKIDALIAERAGIDPSDRVRLDVLRNDVETARVSWQHAEAQLQNQLIVAGSAGRFIPADNYLLDGRFFERGDTAAYIVPDGQRTVRLALAQADIGDINNTLKAVKLQFDAGHDPNRAYVAAISRFTPKASLQVPSPALTTLGGGDLPVDPQSEGNRVLEPVFDLEIAWPVDAPLTPVGGHVRVKFEHPPQPLAHRITTSLRRAFLGRLDA